MDSQWSRRNLVAGALVSALALAPGAALAAEEGYAWAWAGNPTGSYTPSYAYNSRGGTLYVVNESTGNYRVDLTNFSGGAGNVLVSAYGAGGERCKVRTWYATAANTLSLFVRCHDVAGNLANTRFTVLYTSLLTTTAGGQWGAYLWASNPTASHTPPSSYQWNANGSLSTVSWGGTGVYYASLTGLSTVYPSSVQVTAYGEDSAYCKVSSWGAGGGNVNVTVRCFAANGQPANSRFTLSFFTSAPTLWAPTGYVWANDKLSSSYTPYTWFQKNAQGGTNTAGRYGQGSYWVHYPHFKSTSLTAWGWNASSTAQVTAYGEGPEYCKVGSWWETATGSQVEIACFNPGGTPADTQFNQAFMNNDFPPPQ
jgi:hypothetical protein